jgi:uncharacterized protein YhaN
MVTTPQEEPQVEEQPVPEEAGETTEETPEEEVDYKAKAAELEAQVKKMENDLRSKDGQRRRYMDAARHGDTDEVQDQISQVNQELAQGQATRAYNSRYDKEMNRLLSTVQDTDGNLFISEDDAVKIQSDWAAAWEKAKTGDYEGIYDIQIDAAKMVAQEERRRATDERKKLSDEAKNAAKNALEKAGVADLDTGAAIAGGNEELRGSALIERGLRRRNL